MEVRPAETSDVEAVREVADAAWWETYPGILDADTIRQAVADLYDESFLRRIVDERDDILFLVACESRGDSGEASGEQREPRAEDDGEIVGFTTAQQTFADEVEVYTLYVHPDRWGEGIGTRLLESVEASAEAAGADRLRTAVVSGNHVGRSFFESRGFERVETVSTEIADQTVPEDVLEKPL